MPETILIIEDDPNQADVARLLLEHHGFETVVAYDGAEGLRKLYETQPDLIVLDLVLPQIDGWAVCRRIREMSTVPIIIVTSRRSDEEKVKGLRMGADDYLVKPYNPQEFAARVSAVLRRTRLPPPSKSAVMRFGGGDLIIDPSNLTVIVTGSPVELTPTEHRILVFMAEHPGQVVGIEDIFTAVWGFDTDVNVNNVKWYVWRLRQKLEEPDGEARFIFTERGSGYRFTSV